jgi:hypothetical protein
MAQIPEIDIETLTNWLVNLLRTPSPTGDTASAIELVAGYLRELGLTPTS